MIAHKLLQRAAQMSVQMKIPVMSIRFWFAAFSCFAILLGGIGWINTVAYNASAAYQKTIDIEAKMELKQKDEAVFRQEVLSKLESIKTDVSWLKKR